MCGPQPPTPVAGHHSAIVAATAIATVRRDAGTRGRDFRAALLGLRTRLANDAGPAPGICLQEGGELRAREGAGFRALGREPRLPLGGCGDFRRFHAQQFHDRWHDVRQHQRR